MQYSDGLNTAMF